MFDVNVSCDRILFPIPSFRSSTENNLLKCTFTDADRKYIVQTLSTMLMT